MYVVLAALGLVAVGVLEEAFALPAAVANDAIAHPIRDGTGNGALIGLGVVVADRRADFTLERVGRTLGNDVERTADRVAAVERALRPAQYFDTVGDDRRLACFDVAGGVETVRVGRDAGIGAVVVGQTANAAQAHAIERAGIGQAGGEVGQVLDVRDTEQIARLAGERGDRHRHVLQARLALFRGDDDFFQHHGFRCLALLCHSGAR
jgi:hypothetical protein